MSKDEKSVSVPASALADLISAAVDRRVAEIMGAKSPDQKIAEAMAAQRGTNNPGQQEQLVDCRSPITKSTFTARLLLPRKPGGQYRVVELLDYERPDGWDRHAADGGLVPNGTSIHKTDERGDPTPAFDARFALSVVRDYYNRDNRALIGKPLDPVWRVDAVAAPGSVTLTPEQMSKLGISAEQITAALSEAPPVAVE
jgi:hypothetical protein